MDKLYLTGSPSAMGRCVESLTEYARATSSEWDVDLSRLDASIIVISDPPDALAIHLNHVRGLSVSTRAPAEP